MKLSDSIKRITVFNTKGGVGKTSVSLNLALTFDFGIVSNDTGAGNSLTTQVLEKGNFRILAVNEGLPDFPADIPIIYDLGGYPDTRFRQFCNNSDLLLIPVLAHRENIQDNLNLIKEIIEDGYMDMKKIIIIINQTTGNEFVILKAVFNRYWKDIAVFNIKKSKAFAWMIEQKKSIQTLALENKFHRKSFGAVAEQFNQIAEFMVNG